MRGAQRSLDDRRTKTGAEGWLIAERPLDGDGQSERKYYFSNLPARASLKELAAAVRSRWPIEQFYQDGKQLCGLGDYGRSDTICWPPLDGLHCHVALVMLSYSFLALTRWRAGTQAILSYAFGSASPSAAGAPRLTSCSAGRRWSNLCSLDRSLTCSTERRPEEAAR